VLIAISLLLISYIELLENAHKKTPTGDIPLSVISFRFSLPVY
jgi:hypothetical protein